MDAKLDILLARGVETEVGPILANSSPIYKTVFSVEEFDEMELSLKDDVYKASLVSILFLYLALFKTIYINSYRLFTRLNV